MQHAQQRATRLDTTGDDIPESWSIESLICGCIVSKRSPHHPLSSPFQREHTSHIYVPSPLLTLLLSHQLTMLIRFLPVLLTVAAQSSSWLRGLDTTLRNIGCQDFAVAISSSTPVIRNDSTIYCPTVSGLSVFIPQLTSQSFAVSESERAERIAYHIVSGSLNSTDIARPRQQTIALTELIQDNRLQALILETAPSGDSILARGSDWNVSSVGMQVVYEGIKIQPMNQVPSPQDASSLP